jgi:cell division transport system permease protein
MIKFLYISLALILLGSCESDTSISHKQSDEVHHQLSLFLDKNTPDLEVELLLRELRDKDYVTEAVFISADEAMELMKRELGEEGLEILDTNPFPPSIELKLNKMSSKDLKGIKHALELDSRIQDVIIDRIY